MTQPQAKPLSKPKPIGPIPLRYAAQNGMLMIGGQSAAELVAAHGSPLFVYDAAALDERMAALRAAMPARLHIHYAMKANPFAPLLKHMVGLADGIDIASGGELAMALAAGAAPQRISFAGPGKRDAELAAAIAAGVTINLESPSEAQRAIAIAEQHALPLRAAIRVNPDFAIQGAAMRMGGGAKPFGMDVPLVAPVFKALRAAGADWRGFHIYAGSQNLRADTLIAAQAATLALTERLTEQCGFPAHVNLGGGFGIPYFPGECPLDIAAIGSALAQRLAALPKEFAATQFAIELGRYLVGEAGIYLTQIVDRKQSAGQTFLVVDGGLHHQLAASGNFGTVIRRNYPAAIATKMNAAPQESACIVGCLCTPLDLLCDNGPLPMAEVGDIVAIFCAGAYGASASPAQFLGHGPAAEKFVQ